MVILSTTAFVISIININLQLASKVTKLLRLITKIKTQDGFVVDLGVVVVENAPSTK